ncbi:hypothetical protein PAJ34TS1_51630 [Paenibacillus azoreducens]|uniref:Uncharacterized protein n=1 Tax=Paenibacillus azoreducens TaxID=116718 RepID=A0A919Y871_9BACL|nr:hypothetical protein J34TS1_06810 [Paenibacillus azoreducens]
MENRLTFLSLNRHETVGKSELCIKQGSNNPTKWSLCFDAYSKYFAGTPKKTYKFYTAQKNPRFGIEARVREQKYFIYMD